MKKTYIIFSCLIAFACILTIVILATGAWRPFLYPQQEEFVWARIITPRENGDEAETWETGLPFWEEDLRTHVPMREGEIVISILARESETGFAEDQFVAYLSAYGSGNQIYVAWIGFDPAINRHRRMWETPTLATRPETLSMFSIDLIGDRNNCIVITGMNNRNQHTMTVLRRNFGSVYSPFVKIAELEADGSIVIQETVRSIAYQRGIAHGHSFNIALYNHDEASDNILDRVEIIFSYNPATGRYERTRETRIPGSQVEQQRVREILSGAPGVFEDFISGLWYFVSPQGTIDKRQYIYFNPSAGQIVFSSEGTYQIYRWMNSTPFRYGLHVRSQNQTISTLRRFIIIEVVSLDSIRLRVHEDIRLTIRITPPWSGTYRRARMVDQITEEPRIFAVNAIYESPWGRFEFHDNGEYTIVPSAGSGNNAAPTGRYAFFNIGEQRLLELRPYDRENAERLVYMVETGENSALILTRVRLGINGVQNLMEPPITLTPVQD